MGRRGLLDSVRGNVRSDIKMVVQLDILISSPQNNGVKFHEPHRSMQWTTIFGPQQDEDVQLGFYVIKYMRNIIEHKWLNGIPIECGGIGEYTEHDIDELHNEWVKFVPLRSAFRLVLEAFTSDLVCISRYIPR